MSNIPTHSSLVKYSTPVLVSIQPTKGKAKERKNKPAQQNEKQMEILRTEELLSQIIPPKEYVLEHGQYWIQTVLSTPATRIEVIALQEELDKRILQQKARDTGICPIREELYDQCFDELIRQITIDCKQRGLLLVKVRDEIRNQLGAYKNLYESSIAYGMRKKIESEQTKTDMNNYLKKLEKECKMLEDQTEELQNKIETTKTSEEEWLQQSNEQHQEEVQKIKARNNEIKDDLEKILSGNK